MPRQPRLDAPGLLQHVMARGIERRKIFRDDKNSKVPEVGDRKSEVRKQKSPSTSSAEGGLFFQFRPETEKDNKNPQNRVICEIRAKN